MEKMTKRIFDKSILNREVAIDPIPYDIALKVKRLETESALILDVVSKIEAESSRKDLENNMMIKNLLTKDEELYKEEIELRQRYNYWYYGLDNLEDEDRKEIEAMLEKKNKQTVKIN